MARNRIALLGAVLSMSLCQNGRSQTLSAPAPNIRYEVAAIKLSPPDVPGWRIEYTPHGFTARGVTLHSLLQEAYGMFGPKALAQEPDWASKQRFDIEAEVDAGNQAAYKSLDLNGHREVLKKLLEERFALRAHEQDVQVKGFELAVAGGMGPQLHPAKESADEQIRGMEGLVRVSRLGHLQVENISMTGLCSLLQGFIGQPVVNGTALPGRYDFELEWRPDDLSAESSDGPSASIYTAVREQLGLKLEPKKVRSAVLEIDGASLPTPN